MPVGMLPLSLLRFRKSWMSEDRLPMHEGMGPVSLLVYMHSVVRAVKSQTPSGRVLLSLLVFNCSVRIVASCPTQLGSPPKS